MEWRDQLYTLFGIGSEIQPTRLKVVSPLPAHRLKDNNVIYFQKLLGYVEFPINLKETVKKQIKRKGKEK